MSTSSDGSWSRPAARLLLWLCLGGLTGVAVSGCGSECCDIDSFPIGLWRAPAGDPAATPGGLLARATSPSVTGGAPFSMVVDTGSPITVLSATGGGPLNIERRAFELRDPLAAAAPVRARFREIGALDLPLGPAGATGIDPLGILGGDLLRAFSIQLRFQNPCPAGAPAGNPSAGCASVTFWRHLGASGGFLQDSGFAVLRFSLFGGGTISALGDPDFLGGRSMVDLPPSRVVLRACGAPRLFVPTEPRELCCTRSAETLLATGVDLSLLVATGVGPMVLSESAWARLSEASPGLPALTPGDLLVATWRSPIKGPGGGPVQWGTLPRVALVDREGDANSDPGPCVELARARRIEWVSYQNLMGTTDEGRNACVQPCDTDPRENDKAQNSAAYVELGGNIPVAVVADDEPFLQSLRFDVRPEGPEIDGVIGAAAFGAARLEIDYLSTPKNAVFSCEPGTDRQLCWAGARCTRLPDKDQRHICFGLGPQSLPAVCAPSGC